MSNRENVSDRYLSSAMNRDGVDNTLSRMLGNSKDEVKNYQFCGECGERCLQGYVHPEDKTIVYCKRHYEELVAPICDLCNKSIMGVSSRFQDGKNYHPQCFNLEHSCNRCSRPIMGGESKFALNKHYHTKCFTCHLCNTNLDNTFIDRGGKPYCHKCNNDLNRDEKGTLLKYGASTMSIENKDIADRNKTKVDLYDNVQKGKESCNWCRKIITTEAVSFNSNIYHQECFTCSQCTKQIGNQPFINRNGVAICQECGKSTNSNSVLCGGCGKQITTTFMTAGNTKYHPNCLVCNKCKRTLEKGYIEKGGKLLCSVCGISSPTTTYTETKTAPAAISSGYSLNPICTAQCGFGQSCVCVNGISQCQAYHEVHEQVRHYVRVANTFVDNGVAYQTLDVEVKNYSHGKIESLTLGTKTEAEYEELKTFNIKKVGSDLSLYQGSKIEVGQTYRFGMTIRKESVPNLFIKSVVIA
eukprot:gene3908-4878_t